MSIFTALSPIWAVASGVGVILFLLIETQNTPRVRIVFAWLFSMVLGIVGSFADLEIASVFATILFIASLIVSFGSPRRAQAIFKIAENLGRQTIPPEIRRIEQSSYAELSLADTLYKKLRSESYYDDPPSNFWSLIYPRKMIHSKVHSIRCKLSPPSSWSAEQSASPSPPPKEVAVSIIATTFIVKPESRKIILSDTLARKSASFFVTPQKRGQHSIRIEIHADGQLVGWRELAIRVTSSQEFLALVALLLGLIGSILTIGKLLGLLPK